MEIIDQSKFYRLVFIKGKGYFIHNRFTQEGRWQASNSFGYNRKSAYYNFLQDVSTERQNDSPQRSAEVCPKCGGEIFRSVCTCCFK